MCRSGGRHLGKFAWGSNLALVFEAMQSRPSTTFPESWHDYWKQYFRSFGRGICLPDSPNWRYRQNYDVNKWQVWIREAFLGRISASPEARMDDIVGKTYQTYNSLPPCQEIDISCHKLSQNDDFVSRVWSPPSWNPICGTTWLRFSSLPRFRTRARNPVGPRPVESQKL